MERKDLTPSEEMLFNVYNNNHKTKIELEKVRNIDINNKKLIIEYFNENTLVNNVPLFFHDTHYKIVIEDEGNKDTISVSEKVYDQLSVGDTVEVYKKVTYLFGTYLGTDYTLKN